MKRTEFYKQV